MKKIISIITMTLLFAATIIPLASANAKEETKEKPAIVQAADDALKKSFTLEDKIINLKKAGWEVQTYEEAKNDGIVAPLSTGGNATINYLFAKQEQTPGSGIYYWLIQAMWKSTAWDDNSGKVEDYFTLGLVNQNNQSANVVPQFEQIYPNWCNTCSDKYNYSSHGWTESFTGASTQWRIADTGNEFLSVNIGQEGEAWFYVTKPSNGTSYYITSAWGHTWSTTSISLQSVTVSWPWSVSATFSTTTNLNKWQKAGSNYAVTF